MSTTTRLWHASALMLLCACNRNTPRAHGEATTARAATSPAQAPSPTRLISLPVSAYLPSLALDGDDVYLLTPKAGYRLTAGKPPEKIDLELGNGSVLAESGIVYWSKGAIWNAAKHGNSVWRLASVPKQPEYLVTSGVGIAWFDRVDDGTYRIQSLSGGKVRVLTTQKDDISALHMIHEWVFYVRRAKDNTWRIGRVHVTGGEPVYTDSRSGPTPSQLTGTEHVAYYDMDKSEIHQLTTDLKSENLWARDFVCSPIVEAKHIFCARVEGLFELPADNHVPKPLTFGRRDTITLLRANSKHVVWIVDLGANQLAVDTLPVE